MLAINRLNDPPTWLKVATTLEKPQPHPCTSVKFYKFLCRKLINPSFNYWPALLLELMIFSVKISISKLLFMSLHIYKYCTCLIPRFIHPHINFNFVCLNFNSWIVENFQYSQQYFCLEIHNYFDYNIDKLLHFSIAIDVKAWINNQITSHRVLLNNR